MGIELRPALESALPLLRCPVCSGALHQDADRIGCAAGHSFDLARQGYLNLVAGAGHPGTGDTAAMVAARERFLGAGHFAPIAERVASVVARDAGPAPVVLDVAAGTGYYAGAVLDLMPAALGLCVDVSSAALRRAARAHQRAAAIGADAWQPLPIRAQVVTTALSIFGPRNAAELDRVLVEDGTIVVVAPGPTHLRQLVEPLGMIGIDPRKSERQAAAFDRFEVVEVDRVAYGRALGHDDMMAAVGMGPTAAHIGSDELAARVRQLPAVVEVDVAVDVTSYTRVG